MMQMRPEALFAATENCSEALHIGLAGVLRRTVFPEPSYTPFPQSSMSKLALAKNLLQPQSILLLSTGEADLGAHNFSNQLSPSSVVEAEAQATRLLGQNIQCIQLPKETMST